jgi:hypothetical protein
MTIRLNGALPIGDASIGILPTGAFQMVICQKQLVKWSFVTLRMTNQSLALKAICQVAVDQIEMGQMLRW